MEKKNRQRPLAESMEPWILPSENFALILPVESSPNNSPTPSTATNWVKELGGETEIDKDAPFEPVVSVDLTNRRVTDNDLAMLKNFTSLQILELGDTPITDAALAHLGGLTSLRVLSLMGTRITDHGLISLAALTNLEELELIRTQTTDAGLAHLKSLNKLRTLGLSLTKVTDVGLVHLRNLSNLEWLDLFGTGATSEGVRLLQEALPKLNILGVGIDRERGHDHGRADLLNLRSGL